jgi:hypothetical protein
MREPSPGDEGEEVPVEALLLGEEQTMARVVDGESGAGDEFRGRAPAEVEGREPVADAEDDRLTRFSARGHAGHSGWRRPPIVRTGGQT